MEYIICRVCGYIETADKKDQPCPACGFPKTVWTEYKARRMNETRYKLLDLHVHPIFVHFPIVFTALVVVLPFLAFFAPFQHATMFFSFTNLVCFILPFLTLIGAITGLIGGKMRYKSYKAPLLRQKLLVSVVYFLLSCALGYIAVAYGVQSGNALWVILLGILCSGCAAYLGKMGSYLFATKLGPYVAG